MTCSMSSMKKNFERFFLQAAQFGKCFISDMRSDSYVTMCRLLRALNAVRDPKVGIPITITQYPLMLEILNSIFEVM